MRHPSQLHPHARSRILTFQRRRCRRRLAHPIISIDRAFIPPISRSVCTYFSRRKRPKYIIRLTELD